MGTYFIQYQDVIKDENGNVVEIHCTYDPETFSGSAPDGRKEVIFTSFYDEYQGYQSTNGNLYILSYEGRLISKTKLADAKEGNTVSNGGKAAPVVCDIDNDGDFEIVIKTMAGAIAVYDIK